jgi:uncharacterized protein GlcG (DUF336 family)
MATAPPDHAARRAVSGANPTPYDRGSCFTNLAQTGLTLWLTAVPRGRPEMRVTRCLTLAAACMAPVVTARAQLITHKDLSAAMALTIAETALATCTASGYHVSVTVLGRDAEVIVQVRGDSASPHTIENSFRKACTARTFRVASGEIAKRYKDDPALFMVHLANVVPAQGGLPIGAGGDVIGAVAVSGSPGGDKDEVCAQAGIDKAGIDKAGIDKAGPDLK